MRMSLSLLGHASTENHQPVTIEEFELCSVAHDSEAGVKGSDPLPLRGDERP
jgi:hypothetical protein